MGQRTTRGKLSTPKPQKELPPTPIELIKLCYAFYPPIVCLEHGFVGKRGSVIREILQTCAIIVAQRFGSDQVFYTSPPEKEAPLD